MPIREATRITSDYDTNQQRASAYHAHRVDDIKNGEHDLDDDPHAVVHLIPAGALEPSALAVNEPLDVSTRGLTDFNAGSATERHTTTGVQLYDSDEDNRRSYSELANTGIVEVVSNRFANTDDETELYDGAEFEAALTALASWADSQYGELGIGTVTIHITLQGLNGLRLNVPEQIRKSDSHPAFESENARPFPFLFEPMDGSGENLQQIREDLSPLFDALWSTANQSDSPYTGSLVRHRYIADQASQYK